jgi:hypothetical protein
MKNRYQAWAGVVTSEWIEAACKQLSENIDFPPLDAIWPIVDSKSCGEIDGKPTPQQWFCIAFTPEDQRTICEALNYLNSQEEAKNG